MSGEKASASTAAGKKKKSGGSAVKLTRQLSRGRLQTVKHDSGASSSSGKGPRKRSTWRNRLFGGSSSSKTIASCSSAASSEPKQPTQEELNQQIEKDLKASKKLFAKLVLQAENDPFILRLNEVPLVGADKALLKDGGYFSRLVIEVNQQTIDGQFLRFDLMLNNTLKDLALLRSYLVLAKDHAKGLICNTFLLVTSIHIRWRNRAIKFILDKILSEVIEELSPDDRASLHARLIKYVGNLASYKNAEACSTDAMEEALGPEVIRLIEASENNHLFTYMLGIIEDANIHIPIWREKADEILDKAGDFYTYNMLQICSGNTYTNSRDLGIKRNKINLDVLKLTGDDSPIKDAESEVIALCRKIIKDHTQLLKEAKAVKLPAILQAFHHSDDGEKLYQCLIRPELSELVNEHFGADSWEKAKAPELRSKIIQHQLVQDIKLEFEQSIKAKLFKILKKLYPDTGDDATKAANQRLRVNSIRAAMQTIQGAEEILKQARSGSVLSAEEIHKLEQVITRDLPLLFNIDTYYHRFMEFIKSHQPKPRAMPTSPSFIGSVYIHDRAADALMSATPLQNLETLISVASDALTMPTGSSAGSSGTTSLSTGSTATSGSDASGSSGHSSTETSPSSSRDDLSIATATAVSLVVTPPSSAAATVSVDASDAVKTAAHVSPLPLPTDEDGKKSSSGSAVVTAPPSAAAAVSVDASDAVKTAARVPSLPLSTDGAGEKDSSDSGSSHSPLRRFRK